MIDKRQAKENTQEIIKVSDFKMVFGKNTVIKNLSFTVNKGEVFGFLGSNGSGKTTTVRALLGLCAPTEGKLLINNQQFKPGDGLNIGYLPEERGLYKKEKVKNIMLYFADLKGLTKKEANAWIDQYLTRVELLDKKETRLDKLSSGQQQKVQLGITIMGKPELLILDEPTKGFDPINRQLLLTIIEEERARGATIMMITHHMEEVERLCDRILLLKDGEAKSYGRVEDIKDAAGKQKIKIIFNGQLPQNDALFEIQNETKNQAELAPKNGAKPEDILRFLLDQQISLRQYSIERPSLEEIFIKTYGYQKTEEIK